MRLAHDAPTLEPEVRTRLALRHRPRSARDRFWLARRSMNLALVAWLRERPAPDEIDIEVAGTINVVRHLARLMRTGGAP